MKNVEPDQFERKGGINTTYERTLRDILITLIKGFWCDTVEKVILNKQRFLYEKNYANEENEPFISVYTPTYNRSNILIERAVSSVIRQSYKNIEYIIVGDCCTDDTEQLIKKVGDSRIRFYNLSKRGYRYPPTVENHWYAGPVVAANTALRMIKGNWIARIDDDDMWTDDHIESLLRCAQEGKYEFVTGDALVEREGIRKIQKGNRAFSTHFYPNGKSFKGRNPYVGPTSSFFYRSYLKIFKYNIDCWRKNWNRVNDIDLVVRLANAGAIFGHLDKVVTYITPRPGETTVASDAYMKDAENKLRHFEFKSR
jgi:glycosyltransferase involved in cell wall biosynthesis